MFFQPFLDLQHAGVQVQLLSTEAEAPGAVVALDLEQHVARHALSDVRAAEAFDQVHIQIAGRGGAAGTEQVVAVGQVLAGGELHARKALDELAGETPVGRRLAVVQQARMRHPEGAGGLAADRTACGMLLAEPGRDLRVAGRERVEVGPERRQDDRIGIFQCAVDRDLGAAEARDRIAVGAHQPRFERWGERAAQLPGQTQTGHMKEILGLHESRSEYAFGCQDADATQGMGVGHGLF